MVTVNNTGRGDRGAADRHNVGSPYAGTQSGWTDAPTGTSTYTALAAWPAEPTNPVILTPPAGPAPGGPPAKGGNPNPPTAAPSEAIALLRGGPGRPEEGVDEEGHRNGVAEVRGQERQGCQESFLHRQVHAQGHGQDGHPLLPDQGDQDRPHLGQAAEEGIAGSVGSVGAKRHVSWHAGLVVSTKQPKGPAKVSRGTLTIKT